jgi:hypothetical protein
MPADRQVLMEEKRGWGIRLAPLCSHHAAGCHLPDCGSGLVNARAPLAEKLLMSPRIGTPMPSRIRRCKATTQASFFSYFLPPTNEIKCLALKEKL